MLKRILCLIISSLMCLTLLASCQEQPQEILAVASTDNYRNYYEIFVYSFADSDGDGIGDFNGVTEKLDYLNDGDPNSGDDLGIDGIWFMPIMPSPSYHKYDVTDYYAVHEEYGTMEDFENMVAECDKRGIDVIIDLVLNHSSSQHPWFLSAIEELQEGKTDGYAQYYSIPMNEDERSSNGTYHIVPGTSYIYEGNFTPMMPELKLSNPDVREEITNMMEFWSEKGVDGFRLDAVKYFDSGDTDGEEFMTWLSKTAKSIDEDMYMVGELWDGASLIGAGYETGIDSFFNFPYSNSSGGKIASTLNSGNPGSYFSSLQGWNEYIDEKNTYNDAIDAVFLSNHDMVRSGNAFKSDAYKSKLAASIYMLSPGNSFIYYGEEVGITNVNQTDPSYRTSIPWSFEGDGNMTVSEPPPGVTPEGVLESNPEKSVEEQQADDSSLMRHYSNLITLKLQNPEIQRGTITELISTDQRNVSGALFEYEESAVIVLHNLGDEEFTVEVTSENYEYTEIRGQVTAQDPLSENEDGTHEFAQATLEGTTLTIPAYTSVVLK